ncbi:hypothetical protein [Nostoc punctiforme]|uniref:Uncharacterized protein n=1 Tax=Nostoc punctiforme (strain ATCC 29133 / PCC 73102) TaxID=63737 RepID=B2JB54_NOSP7|nr:hypothetical protein [Nostoc punctiforme]ACC85158.1 hypothetical protein Npun_BF010 [Nostoc punctiforme PCC 73102]
MTLFKLVFELIADLFLRYRQWYRRICGGTWHYVVVYLCKETYDWHEDSILKPLYYWHNEDILDPSEIELQTEDWGEKRFECMAKVETRDVQTLHESTYNSSVYGRSFNED